MNLFLRHKVFFILAILFFLVFFFSIYWFLFKPPSETSLTKVHGQERDASQEDLHDA